MILSFFSFDFQGGLPERVLDFELVEELQVMLCKSKLATSVSLTRRLSVFL